MTMHRLVPSLFAIALLAAACPQPAAGAVYKCMVNGTSNYQDSPCQGGDSAPIEVAGSYSNEPLSDKPAESMSVGELNQAIRAVTKLEKQVTDDYQKATDASARELGSTADRETRLSEAERLRRIWEPKIQAVQARNAEIREALRVKCPNGVNMGPNSTTCTR